MVLTEFDEKTFVEGIKQEGANELAEVTKLIKKGLTDEKLLKEGFDPDIVKSANELLAELS